MIKTKTLVEDKIKIIFEEHKYFLFILYPFLVTLLLIGMYFSRVYLFQQLVAPTIPWLPSKSGREFGLLEMIQNLYLLFLIGFSVTAICLKPCKIEKAAALIAFLFLLFVFLEEIDYGINFYELFSGEHSEIAHRNWHNQETAGRSNVKYFKKVADFILFFWFLVFPMLLYKSKHPLIKYLVPSRWFVVSIIIILLLSQFAQFLQGQGMGKINGVNGNLSGNISEFREMNIYYIFILYGMQLLSYKSHREKPPDGRLSAGNAGVFVNEP